jgi:hypothetical protein
MAARNYGTMNNGYYYDEGIKVGYDVKVGSLLFSDVASHSKGQLIAQLVADGYNKENIEVDRNQLD